MSATAGLRCPECGREAKSERRMFKRNRRWGWIATGLTLSLASWFVLRWPDYQKNGQFYGPRAFVPRTVMVVGWPAFVRWEELSYEKPKAWWAKSDPRRQLSVDEFIRSDRLWSWQAWIKWQVCAATFERAQTWGVLYWCTTILTRDPAPPSVAVDAYMARYVSNDTWPLNGIRNDRKEIRAIDPKWIEPVAAAIVRDPSILKADPGIIAWLALSGRDMNDVAGVLPAVSLSGDGLNQALYVLSGAKIDAEHARALVGAYSKKKNVSGTAITGLVAKLGGDGRYETAAIATAITHRYPNDRIHACITIARIGIPDPTLLSLLEIAKQDGQQAVCSAANIAEAILLGDAARLSKEIENEATFLSYEHRRDHRWWNVSALYGFANEGLLPSDLSARAMLAAADGDGMDNWIDSSKSMSLLLRLRDPFDPEIVAFAERKIRDGGQIGWSAWRAYVQLGRAPASIVDAARIGAEKLSPSGRRRDQIVKEADAIKVLP